MNGSFTQRQTHNTIGIDSGDKRHLVFSYCGPAVCVPEGATILWFTQKNRPKLPWRCIFLGIIKKTSLFRVRPGSRMGQLFSACFGVGLQVGSHQVVIRSRSVRSPPLLRIPLAPWLTSAGGCGPPLGASLVRRCARATPRARSSTLHTPPFIVQLTHVPPCSLRVGRRLGEGGFSVVELVEDTRTGKKCDVLLYRSCLLGSS